MMNTAQQRQWLRVVSTLTTPGYMSSPAPGPALCRQHHAGPHHAPTRVPIVRARKPLAQETRACLTMDTRFGARFGARFRARFGARSARPFPLLVKKRRKAGVGSKGRRHRGTGQQKRESVQNRNSLSPPGGGVGGAAATHLLQSELSGDTTPLKMAPPTALLGVCARRARLRARGHARAAQHGGGGVSWATRCDGY